MPAPQNTPDVSNHFRLLSQKRWEKNRRRTASRKASMERLQKAKAEAKRQPISLYDTHYNESSTPTSSSPPSGLHMSMSSNSLNITEEDL